MFIKGKYAEALRHGEGRGEREREREGARERGSERLSQFSRPAHCRTGETKGI